MDSTTLFDDLDGQLFMEVWINSLLLQRIWEIQSCKTSLEMCLFSRLAVVESKPRHTTLELM